MWNRVWYDYKNDEIFVTAIGPSEGWLEPFVYYLGEL